MNQIAEYLSRKELFTKAIRFKFAVPDTVLYDLTQCYAHCVGHSGTIFKKTTDVERVLKSISNWMQSGKPGLLLYGNCGTGKTRMIQALSYLFHFYANERNTLRVCSATDMTELALSKNEHELLNFNMMKTANYAGIDDLGTEPENVKSWGTDKSPVADVLYHRYNGMKVTVLSTNLNMEMIRQRYGERIFDRICEQYDRISFNFQSFRQR